MAQIHEDLGLTSMSSGGIFVVQIDGYLGLWFHSSHDTNDAFSRVFEPRWIQLFGCNGEEIVIWRPNLEITVDIRLHLFTNRPIVQTRKYYICRSNINPQEFEWKREK